MTTATVTTTDYIDLSLGADEIKQFQRSEESAYWGDMTAPQYGEFLQWLGSNPKPELLVIIVYRQDDIWFILDGYHRWKGACELDITDLLTIREYVGEERSMLGMVLNANRRQISPGRRAMLVQQIREKEGMTAQEASATAKVSARHIQRAQNAQRHGLATYVLDDQMTLEDAVDIGKDRALLKAVKSGETAVSAAVDQVREARHQKRRGQEERRAVGYGLSANGQDGELASREEYEKLLASSRSIMARNDTLNAEVKQLERLRNELMAGYTQKVAELNGAGVTLAELISEIEAEAAGTPPPAPEPVAATASKSSRGVSPEVEERRKAAGYYDMSASEKAAWTRIYGG